MIGGTVLQLHRWPVKSLGGEPVDGFLVDARGVAGDRTHALYDTFKDAPRRLTARQSPRLLAWGACYGPGPEVRPEDPPLPRLTAPGGTCFGWEDPALGAALAADLGREVTLVRDLAGQQDLTRSVLITTQASLQALARELGDDALDLRRFRTNVHVDLGPVPAFAEESWGGRRVTIGDAMFELLHPCVRCVIPTRDPDTGVKDARILRHLTRAHGGLFGINARPLGRARVTLGDAIAVR